MPKDPVNILKASHKLIPAEFTAPNGQVLQGHITECLCDNNKFEIGVANDPEFDGFLVILFCAECRSTITLCKQDEQQIRTLEELSKDHVN